jgi:hypothetical protein
VRKPAQEFSFREMTILTKADVSQESVAMLRIFKDVLS